MADMQEGTEQPGFGFAAFLLVTKLLSKLVKSEKLSLTEAREIVGDTLLAAPAMNEQSRSALQAILDVLVDKIKET